MAQVCARCGGSALDDARARRRFSGRVRGRLVGWVAQQQCRLIVGLHPAPMAIQGRTSRLGASPPLLQNRLLDFFSRIHPAIPAIIFVPVVVAAVWLAADRGYGPIRLGLLIALGLVIWTLTEYWLHRLVFH